jgi:hypothetical protein
VIIAESGILKKESLFHISILHSYDSRFRDPLYGSLPHSNGAGLATAIRVPGDDDEARKGLGEARIPVRQAIRLPHLPISGQDAMGASAQHAEG